MPARQVNKETAAFPAQSRVHSPGAPMICLTRLPPFQRLTLPETSQPPAHLASWPQYIGLANLEAEFRRFARLTCREGTTTQPMVRSVTQTANKKGHGEFGPHWT